MPEMGMGMGRVHGNPMGIGIPFPCTSLLLAQCSFSLSLFCVILVSAVLKRQEWNQLRRDVVVVLALSASSHSEGAVSSLLLCTSSLELTTEICSQ